MEEQAERKERLSHLIEVIQDRTDTLFYRALQELWFDADEDPNKPLICAEEFGLLKILQRHLRDSPTDIPAINRITGILWYLSRDDTCGTLIGDEELLISSLMSFFQPLTQYLYWHHILNLFSNLLMVPSTHRQLMKPEHQFLETCAQALLRHPHHGQIYKAMANFAHVAEEAHIVELLKLGIHNTMLNTLLLYDSNPVYWTNRWNGPAYFCLNFACRLVYHPSGAQAVRVFGQWEFFLQIIDCCQCIEGIKALIVLLHCFWIEQEEEEDLPRLSSIRKILLQHQEWIIEVLLLMLEVYVNYDPASLELQDLEEQGFVYGVIRIKQLVRALRGLSLDKDLRATMIRYLPNIASLSHPLLIRYLQGREAFACRLSLGKEIGGGGKEDHETIAALLEFLLQLWFEEQHYQQQEEEEALPAVRLLEASFTVEADCNLVLLLQQILDLPSERNVPKKIYSLARDLLDSLSSTDQG